MFNAPIMNGKFTDVAMFEMLLEEFMEGMAVNMMCVFKDEKTGNIVIHGANRAVQLVDCEVKDD